MIDHERRLLFVHIARTGGTSIETALVGRDWWQVEEQSKHLSARQARQYYGEEIWNRYFKFSVVRNPWDRIVSMWATGWWHVEPREKEPDDFKVFLQQLRPHPHEKYDSLFYHEILDEALDKVLRFEDIQAEFSSMLRQRGQPDVLLPHTERRQRDSYREYYDQESIDTVARAFKKDIDTYQYSF